MTAPDSTADAGRSQRPSRPQIVLEVKERIRLSSHLVRIIAVGEDVANVDTNGFTDAYSKMLFRAPGSTITPPYDLDALRESLPAAEMPSTRTYTVRRVDHAAGEVWIDFVTHGDEGIAGPWAALAEPGDPVVLRGVGGGYSPDESADWHFLAGDEAAIPAIASALEAMPAAAVGVAVIEVDTAADVMELSHPAGIDVEWVFRDGEEAGTSSVLVDAVRKVAWRAGRVQVFVHGERGAMKRLRPYFTDERGLERSQLSLSPYWAYGRREDAFQAEKREPIGKI